MESLDQVNGSVAVNFPLLYWGAAAFYATLLLFFAVKPCQNYLRRSLEPIQPSNQEWLASLDAFRGLAALWVACFHVWLWNPVFFARLQEFCPPLDAGPKAIGVFGILSGFLIFRSVKHWRTPEELFAYFQRRFFRIYPVYFLVMLLFFLSARTAYEKSAQLWLGQALMAPAFGFRFLVYRPFWSLYAEELFYLVIPVWALLTRGRPLLLAGLASFLLAFLVGGGGSFYALFYYLFLGVTAALLAARPFFGQVPPWAAAVSLGVGAALFYADVTHQGWTTLGLERALHALSPPAQREEFTATLGIAFLLILLSSLRLTFARKALAIFPLRFLGRISYGMFAWHALLVAPLAIFTPEGFLERPVVFGDRAAYPLWVSFLVLIPALVFYAALSYAWIERPLILYGRKWRGPA